MSTVWLQKENNAKSTLDVSPYSRAKIQSADPIALTSRLPAG